MIDRIDDALNGHTDVPLAEISVFGNPHHGIIHAGNLVADQATKDAATGVPPTEWPHQNKTTPNTPQGGGTWVFANNPTFSRTPEEVAADALIGHRWDNYDLLGGRTRLIQGGPESCGEYGWVWADDDGETWVATLQLVSLTTSAISFNIHLRRLGMMGGPAAQYTRGPVSLSWADNLSTVRQLNLVFQDATRTGDKAAFMVTGRNDESDQGDLPCAVFVVELSGSAAMATVQGSEYLSRGLHRNTLDNADPHTQVTPVPAHQTVTYTANGFCAWNVSINTELGPAAGSEAYGGLDYTLFVYFDDTGDLHRVHVTADDYYGWQSSSTIDAASYTIHDLEPCGSTNTCDPTNDSLHAYIEVSYTTHYNMLTYSSLAIRHDGVDTDCRLFYQRQIGHTESVDIDRWQEAMDAGCSVPSNCSICASYALEYGNGAYAPPYYETEPVSGTESLEGDLGGLFSDIPDLGPGLWSGAAITKLFSPEGAPDPGWIKAGGSDDVCRLECLDRHTWAFARSHEYTGHAEQSSTETIAMVHTPAVPEGTPVTLTANRTPYGVQRFAQPPFITYNKMTGDVTSNAAQIVCYL